MKNIGRIIEIVLIIGAIILFAFMFRGCGKIPKGYVLVSQKSIDSINAIAKSIPDTIEKHDTIWPDQKIKWFIHKIYVNDTIIRTDTLKDSEVTIVVNHDSIGYQIIKPNTVDSIWITKKIPVIIQMPCNEKKFFLTGGIGGFNQFIISGEIGYGKGNRTYSFEVSRIGNQTFYQVKTGIKF